MMLRYDFFLSLPIMNSIFLDLILKSEVIHGRALGRQLGFPTANLRPSSDVSVPTGVYLGRMLGDLSQYWALVNVGYRSSLETSAHGEEKTLSIEVYILDFAGDLYGQTIGLSLLVKLRDELHFESVASLVEQIKIDEQTARELIVEINDKH